MIKGSLIDILFQNNQRDKMNREQATNKSEDKIKKQKIYDFTTNHPNFIRQSNKVIKITQFNSSIVIGEDKLLQKNYAYTNSQSPQKSFNIKKIAQFKNKIIASSQRTVQIQLKKKDHSCNLQVKPSSGKSRFIARDPIDKILVAARCNIKNQIPTIQNLAASLNLEQQVFHKPYDDLKLQQIGDILLTQKFQITTIKDILSETNQSLVGQNSKQTSKRIIKASSGQEFAEYESSSTQRKIVSPRKLFSRHIIQQKKYQQNLQKQKRQMLQLKKELNKNYAKPFNPPQNISAQSYIIYQADAKKIKYNRKLSIKKQQCDQTTTQTKKILIHSHKVMAALNPRTAVQIASLTKIMTCIVALEIANKHNIEIKQELVTIGIFEQNIGGTSANIKKGQIYTLYQLLHGLMLPSGNDASLAIAVWGGKTLLEKQNSQQQYLASTGESNSLNNLRHFSKRQSYQRFVAEMNIKANQLNMQKSKFANSHGLSNVQNKSCAFDLGILCQYAINNKIFRQIVSTKVFETQIKIQSEECPSPTKITDRDNIQSKTELKKKNSINDSSQNQAQMEEMKDMEEIAYQYSEQEDIIDSYQQTANLTKLIRWQNSHLLLQNKPEIYIGIKTGVTNTAGPCLASCIEFKGRKFIIIVLNSKSMKYRFKDTQNLRKWIFNKQQFKYNEKIVPNQQII